MIWLLGYQGVYEPMLIAGSGALLTISAKMHVLCLRAGFSGWVLLMRSAWDPR